MKKTLITFFTLIIISFSFIIIFLSNNGYETDNFNQIISKKIKKNKDELDIKFTKIKIKLDVKNFQLFLSTDEPKIKYYDVNLPLSKLDIYIDFISLLKSNIKINKADVEFKKTKISQIKKLVIRIKPSNIKSFILNNILKGEIEGNFQVSLNENLEITDYKVDAKVNKLDLFFNGEIGVKNTNFILIAEKDLILIKSLSTNYKGLPFRDGLIKIIKKDNLIINGSTNSKIVSNSTKLKKIIPKLASLNFLKNDIDFSGFVKSSFNLNFSNSLELKDYSFNLVGDLEKANINFNEMITFSLLEEKIRSLFLEKTKINFNYSKKKDKEILVEGSYKINNSEFNNFKIINRFGNSKSNFDLEASSNDKIVIDALNYKKNKNKKAIISTNFSLINKKIKIENFKYKEGKSLITFNDVVLDKNYKIEKIKDFKINTGNNNFTINFGKKILIRGKRYDGTNLIKLINNSNDTKSSYNFISSNIEINLDEIVNKLNIPINKFSLIGKIKKGEFVKILSKSQFYDGNFLDISLNSDLINKKKVLEIYSDQAKPILSDFSFFNGVEGGKLLFVSSFNSDKSNSQLTITDFKVKDAPGFAKLLTLADLGGIGDLLSGDGISFEKLDIKFNKDKEVMNINELYSIGPSISILMDGYIENKSGLTSLRGTMVPAKELNKLISKIPILGEILVPKEIGEGIFGVSFKIKGLPGKLKTTVNPIKTLTPRFITKALEKKKKKN